jgi:hypothetical protein
MTNGEKYGPAMEIIDQAAADEYFERLVEHLLANSEVRNRAEAEQIERSNLGYYAGYYSNETRERVERLFRCGHPIFGAIAAKEGAK